MVNYKKLYLEYKMKYMHLKYGGALPQTCDERDNWIEYQEKKIIKHENSIKKLKDEEKKEITKIQEKFKSEKRKYNRYIKESKDRIKSTKKKKEKKKTKKKKNLKQSKA